MEFCKKKFMFKTVVVRNVADTLAKEAIRTEETEVDIEKAKAQHENFKQILGEIGLKVYHIEADESLPDCVFVEDIAVIVGSKALITTSGYQCRRQEKEEIINTLKMIPGLEITEMSNLDEDATLDGADVLYTGRELFVGLSSRTNEAGIKVLNSHFKDIKVHGVPVTDNLHLKSFMSMAGCDAILVSTVSEATRATLREVKDKALERYKFIEFFGDIHKANVIYLETKNGSLLLHPEMKWKREEKKALEEIEVDQKIMVDISELHKVDGRLTNCCILLTI